MDPPTKLQESDANKTSHGPISVAEGARAAEIRGEASKQVGVDQPATGAEDTSAWRASMCLPARFLLMCAVR